MQGTQRASAVEEKTIKVSENATEEEAEEGQVGELKGIGNSREWVLGRETGKARLGSPRRAVLIVSDVLLVLSLHFFFFSHPRLSLYFLDNRVPNHPYEVSQKPGSLADKLACSSFI